MAFVALLDKLYAIEQPREPDTSVGPLRRRTATRSRAQVANDAKVMGYMKTLVARLKDELKSAQSELDILRARPADRKSVV